MKTALFDMHVQSGGKLVDFGGWQLPVQYSGLRDEHLTCRSSAGLFDVSHMGEFDVRGPGAEDFLNDSVTNDISKLAIGQAQYTAMCHDHGGIVDDLVIYRLEKDHFLLVVNAANTAKDFRHLSELKLKRGAEFGTFTLADLSHQYSQLALQGPAAESILSQITDTTLSSIKTYWFDRGKVVNGTVPAILARTGYTGEDGFELYVPWNEGPKVWRALVEAGRSFGLKPCGLGARDTLRLEMKYPLYGHELTDDTNPLEAGLGWVTKLGKPRFQGKNALELVQKQGVQRRLVGFKMLDRGIPRQGYSLYATGSATPMGQVTSGTHSPSLDAPIGVGYVSIDQSKVDTQFEVDIRGTRIPAVVVATPFYKRSDK